MNPLPNKLNWKLAVAGGVVLGAGFGTLSIAGADTAAPTTQEIQLLASAGSGTTSLRSASQPPLAPASAGPASPVLTAAPPSGVGPTSAVSVASAGATVSAGSATSAPTGGPTAGGGPAAPPPAAAASVATVASAPSVADAPSAVSPASVASAGS